MKKTGFAN